MNSNSRFKTLISASPDSTELHRLFPLGILTLEVEVLGLSWGLQDFPQPWHLTVWGKQKCMFWGECEDFPMGRSVLRHSLGGIAFQNISSFLKLTCLRIQHGAGPLFLYSCLVGLLLLRAKISLGCPALAVNTSGGKVKILCQGKLLSSSQRVPSPKCILLKMHFQESYLVLNNSLSKLIIYVVWFETMTYSSRDSGSTQEGFFFFFFYTWSKA